MCPDRRRTDQRRGTGPLRSRGHKGAMWLWEVHFRIHKHTLPVCLNVSLSVYCMYSTFQPHRQTDRQTGHIWGATNGRPSPFPSSLPAPCVCHPTQRGEVVRLEWLARRGQLCDHRPLSVCMWDGGRDPQALLQTRLHTGPHKQLLHSQRQPPSSSRNTAGFVLWQHENVCLCDTINHNQAYS